MCHPSTCHQTHVDTLQEPEHDEVQLILNHMDTMPQLKFTRVLALFQSPEALNHADLEEQAIKHTFGGIHDATEDTWVSSHVVLSSLHADHAL